MELFQSIDIYFFKIINISFANPFFDWLMPIITNQHNWNPIYLFLILFLIVKYKKKGVIIVLLLIIAVGLTDLISSHIIKEIFQRLRPCWTQTEIHLLVPCGAGKSFPSSHAANNFALAYILSYFFKQNKWIFYILATLVAYSRVAVGVHYPSDVIGGALLGLFISYSIIHFFNKYFAKKINN
ncbi:MAG: phosphatase PAP2 family protein [Candidatus Kapaibacteriota bacterium]